MIHEAVNELQTVNDFLRWAVTQFHKQDVFFGHGTADAWDEAVHLVCYALHIPLELGHEVRNSRLTTSEKESVVDIIIQRIDQRIPAPYLTNQSWFCGLNFYVDERVLIPRSPIAELIENKFAPWLQEERVERVLDMCTGSGCIAIACAEAFPQAQVDAVDLSQDALDVAQVNIEELGYLQQVFPMQSDLFDAIPEGTQYDLIVSNPPYVDEDDIGNMPDEFHHEPQMALASGADGLDLTKRILKESTDYLTDNGVLVVEVGNSMVHLAQQFSDVPFLWVEFERGGDGVFVLTKEQLLQYQSHFN